MARPPGTTRCGSNMRSVSSRWWNRGFAELLLGAIALLFSHSILAQDLYIIAHPGLTIAADDLKEVYLGDFLFAGATRVVPIHNAAVRTEFTTSVLGMTMSRYDVWWVRKSFRDGINPPTLRASDRETVEFVRKTAGAVGYITTRPPEGVTVIHKVSLAADRGRESK
jgi:hypothetical protein